MWYSDTHNTWEPEENIFANKLIQQYEERHKKGPPIHIRATRVQPEDSRIPAEFPPLQLQVPSSNITKLPSPARQDSPKSVPGYIEPILAKLTDKTVKEAIVELKKQVKCALLQYQSEIPTFAKVLHQEAWEEYTIPPTNPDWVPLNVCSQNQNRDDLGVPNEPRGPGGNNRIGGASNDEALLGTHTIPLLSNPVLTDLAWEGIILCAMIEGSESHPGLPWFRWTSSIIPKVVTEDEKGQWQELPFICFALLNNEPMILGTDGHRKKIFGQTLTANPALPLPYMTGCDENDLAVFYTDHSFN